jgi:hypothetical protein
MAITTDLQQASPWLLLIFSLPASRASQRVGVWRQLQRHGAIGLRNSGYLLPNHPANRERFEWIANWIRHGRGEASVIEVHSIDNLSTEQLVGRFAEARARDYQALIRDLRKLLSTPSPRNSANGLSRLRSRFLKIAAIDFFRSPLRGRVEELLEQAEAARSVSSSAARPGKVNRHEYVNRVWVTRPRPGIDRSASAWLIRRFIDSKARFAFAAEDRVPAKAVPFDMFHGGFGHQGEDCTFETLEKEFRIRNRRVNLIGQIIHDADLGDEKFGRQEGFGLDEVLKGWARRGLADKELLERGIGLIEGLYSSLS